MALTYELEVKDSIHTDEITCIAGCFALSISSEGLLFPLAKGAGVACLDIVNSAVPPRALQDTNEAQLPILAHSKEGQEARRVAESCVR